LAVVVRHQTGLIPYFLPSQLLVAAKVAMANLLLMVARVALAVAAERSKEHLDPVQTVDPAQQIKVLQVAKAAITMAMMQTFSLAAVVVLVRLVAMEPLQSVAQVALA
jgi:hypothetical protein